MKLKTAHVMNFKSVRDSTPFKIDDKITCLVGKNESGKTATLQALSKLNPLVASDGVFNFDLEYPRDAWDESRRDLQEDALTTTWELEPDDISAVTQIVGPKALDFTKPVAISKGYYDGFSWNVAVNDAEVVKNLVGQHAFHPDTQAALGTLQDVSALQAALNQPDAGPKEKELLAFVSAHFPTGDAEDAVVKILESRLPKFVYIPEYFRMPGQISLDDLKAKKEKKELKQGHRVFLALLDLVGASIKDLEDESQFEPLTARLEAASNRLGREIFQYWTQNRHLRVKIRFDHALKDDTPPFNSGRVVRTRIENTRHGVTVSFDDRSAGFVWFFSFLVWFSQAQKNYGTNLVILLDEPGLSLHAKAQADLLRYFDEKLAIFQVVYSTHSPFMIDAQNLLRARTVEDVYREPKEGEPPVPEKELGTKVGDDVLSTDRDTVFPLQACLGYEITQTLFVGKHTLLVEGPSEILYLTWFSRKLSAAGRQGLDKRWVMSPSGGIDKIPAFLSLFSGNKLDVAVLTDLADGQRKRVRDLRESKLLKDGRVLTADVYAGQKEADIEDLIGREAYRDLVRQAFGLVAGQEMPAQKPAAASERVVKEAETHFGVLPPEAPAFDHYRPSEFLIEQGGAFNLPGLATALDRFEKLFTDLNKMLPAQNP